MKNLLHVDTTPGIGEAFSPPDGFTGSYRDHLRTQWATNPLTRQYVAVVGRLVKNDYPVAFVGPYASEAKEIVVLIWKH